MTIEFQNNILSIAFRYDPKIVLAVKTIPGRQWNAALKQWEAPVAHAAEAISVLQPLGFFISPDVVALASELVKQREKIENIKKNSTFYKGALPLYSFQKIGATFLSEMSGALLADVPGLGKTIQTIAALEDAHNILVFCPASLKYTWKEEIEKWYPGSCPFVVDGKPEERRVVWRSFVKWTIANYELLLHDYDEIMLHVKDNGPWEAVVADESTRIANPASQTTQALKSIPTKKKIALSGTPISNSPEDIFSVVDWLSPRYLGSHWQFKDRYCLQDFSYHARIIGYKNLDELSRRLQPLMLRRTKEEVLKDMPAKTFEDIIFDLSEIERGFYEEVRSGIIKDVESLTINERTLQMITVKMLRLKQTTDHPHLIGKAMRSSKLDALQEIIEPIMAAGEKVLVFTQFAEMAKIMQDKLEAYRPLLIYGDVPPKERQEAVDALNNDKSRQLMIMTEAGAYGLNLQAASYVVHYDAPWSLAKLIQREDRVHRIGQTKPVTIYNMIARRTIDEYVIKILHKKQKASVNILRDFERMEGAGISPEDIKEILRL